MASNPFGITQVDVPGLMQTYIGLKRQSAQDAFLAQDRARADQDWQDKQAEKAAYAGVFQAPSAAPSLADTYTGKAAPWGAPSPTIGKLSDVAPAGGATVAPGTVATVAPASPDQAPGGLSLNPEGLQRLARINPKMAFDLSKMSAEQHAAALKNLTDHVAFESQVIGAVRSVPEADRPAAYARVKATLDPDGSLGFPAQWNEQDAVMRQHMGLTAIQAFDTERADKRLVMDQQNTAVDNARADAEFAETKRYHNLTAGQTERRLGLEAHNSSRADREAAETTPSKVLGPILAKVAAGKPLSAAETNAFNMYRQTDPMNALFSRMAQGAQGGGAAPSLPPAPAPAAPAPAAPAIRIGTTATGPGGKKIIYTAQGWKAAN